MQQQGNKQIFKFIATGLVNTLLGLSIIFIFKAIRFNDFTANLIGYLFGISVGFILNKKWVFKKEIFYNDKILTRYLSVIFIEYLANLLVVFFCISVLYINGYVAHAIGLPVYTVLNFYLNRTFVFR